METITVPAFKVEDYRIGSYIETYDTTHRYFVSIDVKWTGERLSFSGSEQRRNTEAGASWGQIVMHWTDEFIDDMDTFSDGWSADAMRELRDIWNTYHLNDMQAGCEHQRAEGVTEVGTLCEVCNYKYGHSWLHMEVPVSTLERLRVMVGLGESAEQ